MVVLKIFKQLVNESLGHDAEDIGRVNLLRVNLYTELFQDGDEDLFRYVLLEEVEPLPELRLDHPDPQADIPCTILALLSDGDDALDLSDLV